MHAEGLKGYPKIAPQVTQDKRDLRNATPLGVVPCTVSCSQFELTQPRRTVHFILRLTLHPLRYDWLLIIIITKGNISTKKTQSARQRHANKWLEKQKRDEVAHIRTAQGTA